MDTAVGKEKKDYYEILASIISLSTEFYVDLFLLYLLYRFMKPQRFLDDGRTEAAAILFAHDGKRARKMLLDWYKEEDEKREEDLL